MTSRPLCTDSAELFLSSLDPEATAVLVAKRMAVEDTSESNLSELREQVDDHPITTNLLVACSISSRPQPRQSLLRTMK